MFQQLYSYLHQWYKEVEKNKIIYIIHTKMSQIFIDQIKQNDQENFLKCFMIMYSCSTLQLSELNNSHNWGSNGELA